VRALGRVSVAAAAQDRTEQGIFANLYHGRRLKLYSSFDRYEVRSIAPLANFLAGSARQFVGNIASYFG
jgi:hypothetical protein